LILLTFLILLRDTAQDLLKQELLYLLLRLFYSNRIQSDTAPGGGSLFGKGDHTNHHLPAGFRWFLTDTHTLRLNLFYMNKNIEISEIAYVNKYYIEAGYRSV